MHAAIIMGYKTSSILKTKYTFTHEKYISPSVTYLSFDYKNQERLNIYEGNPAGTKRYHYNSSTSFLFQKFSFHANHT